MCSKITSLFQKIFFGFLTITFFIGCENSDKELKDFNSRALGIEEAKNVDVNYTIGGRIKARLLSPVMLRVQDTMPYVEFPKTMHVDFYNLDTVIESKLDARYGKYYEAQSKVFLKDSVRVINVKGDTLYCDELWWDRNRTGTEFYTDKPVKIRTRTETLNGIGMESGQDFKNYHIIQVTGMVKVPAAEFPDQ